MAKVMLPITASIAPFVNAPINAGQGGPTFGAWLAHVLVRRAKGFCPLLFKAWNVRACLHVFAPMPNNPARARALAPSLVGLPACRLAPVRLILLYHMLAKKQVFWQVFC